MNLVPDVLSFVFEDVVDATMVTEYTSLPITVTGLGPNYVFGVCSIGGEIDTGTTALSGTFNKFQLVKTSSLGTFVCSLKSTSSSWVPYAVTEATVTISDASRTEPLVTGSMMLSNLTPDTDYQVGIIGGSVLIASRYTEAVIIKSTTTGTITITVQDTSAGKGLVVVSTIRASTTRKVTTKGYDIIPDSFVFTDVTNVAVGTVVDSNIVTVTGLQPSFNITVTVPTTCEGSVDIGQLTTLPGTFVLSKTNPAVTVTTSSTGTLSLQARITTGLTPATKTSCEVIIGGVSATWNVTTA